MLDPGGIANWSITYVDWSEGKWHPRSFRARDITYQVMKNIAVCDKFYSFPSDVCYFFCSCWIIKQFFFMFPMSGMVLMNWTKLMCSLFMCFGYCCLGFQLCVIMVGTGYWGKNLVYDWRITLKVLKELYLSFILMNYTWSLFVTCSVRSSKFIIAYRATHTSHCLPPRRFYLLNQLFCLFRIFVILLLTILILP